MDLQSKKLNNLPKGFGHLDNPDILVDMRYAGYRNFVGRPVDGYKNDYKNKTKDGYHFLEKDHPVVLTLEAIDALNYAQTLFAKDGYRLVIYDGYRPARSVKFFADWALNKSDQLMKEEYYPYIDKEKLSEEGFVAFENSSHSRGSAVDITVIKDNLELKPIETSLRLYKNGRKIIYLDDNTIDMGSSFDIFDEISYTMSEKILPFQRENRLYLEKTMVKAGFVPYEKEWWHFGLGNEPFPNTYFDFEIIYTQNDSSS